MLLHLPDTIYNESISFVSQKKRLFPLNHVAYKKSMLLSAKPLSLSTALAARLIAPGSLQPLSDIIPDLVPKLSVPIRRGATARIVIPTASSNLCIKFSQISTADVES